jgi:hypothetical protein
MHWLCSTDVVDVKDTGVKDLGNQVVFLGCLSLAKSQKSQEYTF